MNSDVKTRFFAPQGSTNIPISYSKIDKALTNTLDFPSLDNEKHHEELVKIVTKIFAQICTKDSVPTENNVSTLNEFLLTLPKAGLSNEVLTDLHNKYKAKFGKHIDSERVDKNNVRELDKAIGHEVSNFDTQTIRKHTTIAMHAKSFDNAFTREIKSAQPQLEIDKKWKQQELTEQQKGKLTKLQAENAVLRKAFCGLGKFFHKGPIEKNRLEIDSLEAQIYAQIYGGTEIKSREKREITQQKNWNNVLAKNSTLNNTNNER